MHHSLLLLLFASSFLISCNKDSEDKQALVISSETTAATQASSSNKTVHIRAESRAFIKVEPVSTQRPTEQIRAPGQVEFRQQALSKVGVQVAGRVAAVQVQLGNKVRVGDVLLILYSPEAASARATLVSAHANLRLAEETAKRQAQMVNRGVGLELEKLEADRQLAEARAEADRANRTAQLLGAGEGERVTVKSPIAGTILKLNATVGAAVNPGDEAIVEIGDASALWIVADVFERDLASLSVDDEVSVELSASLSHPVKGKVSALGVEFADEQRRVPVYITLLEPTPSLRPGMYARVAIQPQQQQQLLLPSAAVLIKDGKRTVVYVEVSDGVYEQRAVMVGDSANGKVPVLEGLQHGDKVVVQGVLLLDGEAEQLL